MKKRSYQNRDLLYRYYRKFTNLRNRISQLMRTGEFYTLTRDFRNRMVRRLQLLYDRLVRIAGKQKLKWAGTALGLIMSAAIAQAQFAPPVSLSGFFTNEAATPAFADFDGDGDLDIVIGSQAGDVYYIQNDNGVFSRVDNPLNSISVGYYSVPVLVDLDDDGDLDLVVGDQSGTFRYFRNDGGAFTEMTGVDNPFDGIDIGSFSHPVFVDLDGDGDLDMVTGTYFEEINYFRNDGGVFTEITGVDNPLDGVLFTDKYITKPAFGDVDGDGDLDLVVCEYYGSLAYFRNDAGVFTQQTGANNPFDGIQVIYFASPALWDVDGDGDVDLVVGDYSSPHLRYFRNDGGTFVEKRGTPNPFEGIIGLLGAAPAFSDVDNDGDLDLLIGEKYGTFKYYENTDEGFVPRFGAEDPFDGITSGNLPKPVFVDVDGDSDEDLVLGDQGGTLRYFIKEAAGLFFERTGSNNPFDAISLGTYAAPAFADLDGDGDLDLALGNYYGDFGRISYFRNVSGDYIEMTGVNNPFESIYTNDSIESPLNPAFADIDRDGDLDLFVGVKYAGSILHYINNEGTFEMAEGEDNPFDEIYLGFNPSLAFVDIDNDGDLDLFVGIGDKYGDGQVFFFENISVPPINSIKAEIVENPVSIYSFDRTIVVDAGADILKRVDVYSVSGTLIASETINQPGRYELHLPGVIPGLYIVRAFTDGMPKVEKVLLR